MTRSMHIYCDGGFGNRFNGLVSGLVLARLAGLQPVVVWPRNNWCGAGYGELFADGPTVLDRELLSYGAEKAHLHFFMTEDHLNLGVANLSPLQLPNLDQALAWLQGSSRDVFFHSPLIPAYLDPAAVRAQVRQLPLQRAIVSRAMAFMASRRLKDYLGIHIRKTDFGSQGSDDKGLFELLRNCPQKQFFVCSDDASVEQQFASLPNVTTYPKRAYVEPLVAGGWNTPTTDHSGRVYACNVNRSALSVEDAVIDLLLLSHSQVVDTSNSTFRNTALLLQAARNEARSSA